MKVKMMCASCGAALELPGKAGFRETCPFCDAWLHSCVNCALWVREQCTEPSAEKVRDPEGQNFCEWYEGRDKGQGKREKEGGKEAAEELWKKLIKQKEE